MPYYRELTECIHTHTQICGSVKMYDIGTFGITSYGPDLTPTVILTNILNCYLNKHPQLLS